MWVLVQGTMTPCEKGSSAAVDCIPCSTVIRTYCVSMVDEPWAATLRHTFRRHKMSSFLFFFSPSANLRHRERTTAGRAVLPLQQV